MKSRERIASAVLSLSLAVMLISALLFLSSWWRDRSAMLYWRSVARMREDLEDRWTGEGILPRFQALHEAYPDLIGWIRLDGTPIDYPVMQTKDDPEQYLRLDLDGDYRSSGTPFADYRCEVVPVQGANTIIYAHDTLFSALYRYSHRQDGRGAQFYRDHPSIRFDTLTGEGVYEVAAAFFMDGDEARLLDPWDPEDEEAYTFYNYLEVDSPEGFRRYAEGIEAAQILDTDVELSMDRRRVTLICCASELLSGIRSGGRFVVIAQEAS